MNVRINMDLAPKTRNILLRVDGKWTEGYWGGLRWEFDWNSHRGCGCCANWDDPVPDAWAELPDREPEIKDRTDRWMEFLRERMNVIRGARLEGWTPEQIINLVSINSEMQGSLLCIEADRRNEDAKKQKESSSGQGGEAGTQTPDQEASSGEPSH